MSTVTVVKVRRVLAAGVAASFLWCGMARAQVLEQVPPNAMGVFKVNNLQQVSQKAAKLAKEFGLDEVQPQFKDPLGALMDETNVHKGVNKSGDMAIVGFGEGKKDENALVLIPVDDYQAFVSNFEAVGQAEGGVQEVKNPKKGGSLFIVQRGKYAAMSPDKELLNQKPNGGLKLSGAAAKEAQNKDAIFYINMPAVRDKILPEMQKHRQDFIDQVNQGLAQQPQAQPYAPVFKTLAGKLFDAAEQFVKDSQGAVFSVNLNDRGILFGGMGQFDPNSEWGKTISDLKNTDQPLLAGLPNRKYFAFGGAAWDSKTASDFIGRIIEPIRKDLAGANEQGKEIASMLDSLKTMIGASHRQAIGYVVPTAAGNESLLQAVQVFAGDAKSIDKAEQNVLALSSKLFSGGAQNGVTMKLEPKGQKTVDGVNFKTFNMSVQADANDPQAVQAQGIMNMFYGPGGLTTNLGVVNDNTYLIVQGGSEKLLTDAVAAAKAGKDDLSSSPAVRAVSGQLPKSRVAEQYVALDNIVQTAVNYAQMFGLPIKMKIPADLPPLGISISSEGPAVRGDLFVPAQTVQSLVAAGLDAYRQMQGGDKGGL